MEMPVGISSALHARLIAEAAAAPGEEVCGLLFGDDGQIEETRPCANVSPSAADSFEIDPAALIAAHRAMRGGGAQMIGCYHSHPQGTATPSARDAAAAETGALWLIVAGGQVRGWRAGADAQLPSRFVEVVLAIR